MDDETLETMSAPEPEKVVHEVTPSVPKKPRGRPRKHLKEAKIKKVSLEKAEKEMPKKERERYGSFHEAWPHVKELRRYCTQGGHPRMGMTGDDIMRAQELISEYRNG